MSYKKVCFVVSLIVFSLNSCYNQVESNMITGKEGKPLPSFNLLLPDSSSSYHTSEMKGQPTVFFYFGPDCPYCQQQMDEIKTKMIELGDIQFVVLTGDGFDGMKNFAERNGLEEYSNVTTGLDRANFFRKYYKLKGYPFSAFYDRNGMLRYAYLGKIDITKLISMTRNLK